MLRLGMCSNNLNYLQNRISRLYGGPQLSRQNQKPHDKNKNLTAKPKTSRQKQKPYGKTENLTAKTKTLRQNRKPHGKNKNITAKPKTSRQNPILQSNNKTALVFFFWFFFFYIWNVSFFNHRFTLWTIIASIFIFITKFIFIALSNIMVDCIHVFILILGRQCGRVVSASDSKSGGPGFESLSGHLPDLFFLVPSSNPRPRL